MWSWVNCWNFIAKVFRITYKYFWRFNSFMSQNLLEISHQNQQWLDRKWDSKNLLIVFWTVRISWIAFWTNSVLGQLSAKQSPKNPPPLICSKVSWLVFVEHQGFPLWESEFPAASFKVQLWCKIFGFFILSSPQNERRMY